ncbi:MAG: right-handed parallel beta-helix repeat-containing protein [Candidatus Bathyarchaeia archaeon]
MSLVSVVNATYVEGSIVQDTVWTLVDSPFVVSGDLTILEGATLTIEPGVEVRFGGSFSITVEGRLIAEGLKDKPIKFASNKLQREAGSWVTIKFNSAQHSSLLFCIVEYGTNGITVESGSLNIQNSTVQCNSESGITVLGGNVAVKDSEIVNNTKNGIFIAGGQVNCTKNSIAYNGDGIVLTGDLTSEINISYNEIKFNTHSGIMLSDVSTYDTIIIINNAISKNANGFYVSSDVATHITRNYIINNDVGVCYEKGTGHTAHFNDIYGNAVGVDVSSGAFVDATYNYWGSASGPYHESLNPRGEGNPVKGEGANVNFIFFLTHPINHSNVAPTAVLWTDKVVVAPNQPITFVGTNSSDDGKVNEYLFEFGDGNSSGWTTLSLFTHSYSLTGLYTAGLTVRDDFNTSSLKSFVVINVTNLPSLQVSLTLSSYTVAYNGEVQVTVYVSYGGNAVGNANVTLLSVKGGSFASGLTNSSGYFTATFKAPNVTETTNVRIIARASKSSFADGSDHKYLSVIPPLVVQVTAEPSTVLSEEASTIKAYVTFDYVPVSNVTVTISSTIEGNFNKTVATTDADGNAVFVFTAPQVTTKDGVTGIITVNATKSGYMDGSGYAVVTVVPRILFVQLTAEPSATVSEGIVTITVQVTYGESPVAEANVTLIPEAGSFSPEFMLSDYNGYATFTFTAPCVDTPSNITLWAVAAKTGYANGENMIKIGVNPGVLDVEVTAERSSVASEGTVLVTVYVICEGFPVVNASVSLSCTDGTAYPTANLTGADGVCTFVFTAPQTTTFLSVNITASATKFGYASGEEQISITVNPQIEKPSEGLPWLTILLVLIPIVIVVVFVVLVKLKIIVVSLGGEEEAEE